MHTTSTIELRLQSHSYVISHSTHVTLVSCFFFSLFLIQIALQTGHCVWHLRKIKQLVIDVWLFNVIEDNIQ